MSVGAHAGSARTQSACAAIVSSVDDVQLRKWRAGFSSAADACGCSWPVWNCSQRVAGRFASPCAGQLCAGVGWTCWLLGTRHVGLILASDAPADLRCSRAGWRGYCWSWPCCPGVLVGGGWPGGIWPLQGCVLLGIRAGPGRRWFLLGWEQRLELIGASIHRAVVGAAVLDDLQAAVLLRAGRWAIRLLRGRRRTASSGVAALRGGWDIFPAVAAPDRRRPPLQPARDAPTQGGWLQALSSISSPGSDAGASGLLA